MQTIIQRVSEAQLVIAERVQASIGRGIVAFVGIEKDDNEAAARRMAKRILGYRIFADDEGRMNLSLADVDGELLLVPNFTVAADARKGTRAGFSSAAAPDEGKRLFNCLVDNLHKQHIGIRTGIFGADMKIKLSNEGPVTFILKS